MAIGSATAAFVVGAVLCLATSWVLVTRLEMVGERFGLSEALLGLVAALAADTPEITAAVTALVRHEGAVGAGVVIGSNVFNLAALLGLGAIVAGRIDLHRKVVLLGGAVALWVAGVCLVTVTDVVGAGLGLALAAAVLVAYVVVLAGRAALVGRLSLPRSWGTWLGSAIDEEELELVVAIRPRRATGRDMAVAGLALVVVVAAAVAMEWGASTLGQHFDVPGIVIGGLVLAAVTSLPNAVAAVHLAAHGRGAAAFSTALNSNNLNVVAGLLIPGAILGLAASSSSGLLTASWYLGLTLLALVLAFSGRGLGRVAGSLIITGYLLFVGCLLAIS
jgi:cation:H+ antiporter